MFNDNQYLKIILIVKSVLPWLAAVIFFLSAADPVLIAAQTMTPTPQAVVSPSPLATAAPTATPLPIAPTAYPSPGVVAPPPPSNSFAPAASFAPATNYLRNSAAFRQEIARLEINVRRGMRTLPITEVPRVQKDDIIKIRLLDEAVGGIKPDQSNWDWTLLVAFVNPNRRNAQGDSVSEEIRFRKTGWYKEYAVVAPYDAQPVFFFYPKPNYRKKITGLIDKNSDELQKLGEKTIELAGAYAQINSFLNELQYVLLQTQASRYGSFVTYPKPVTVRQPGSTAPVIVQPPPIYNYNAFTEQTIERLARSFNIALPACWQTANGNINYANPLNANSVNQTIYGSANLALPGNPNQNSFGYAVGGDLVGRAQCVAKNVRLEDFDFSVGSLLKQGGIFAAVQLRDKYPQLAYWITLAATAIDFIVKAFQKAPLRIVPTIFSAAAYIPANTGVSPTNPVNVPPVTNPVKLSLYAEAPPSEAGAVTAYPLVVHRWQAEPDAAQIKLYPPELSEPCLHAGQNILKDVSLSSEMPADAFAVDFKLAISGANNYRKEFPLRKNIGLGGWELNLTREETNSLPKGDAVYDAFLVGARGFSEIKSPKFTLPAPMRGAYEIKAESQKDFTAGGRRTVTVRNASGNCRCLQTVTYKPAAGVPLVYETTAASGKNQFKYSDDGKEVSFEIDASVLQPGAGGLELKNYGSEISNLNLKLYPPAPEITDLKVSAGDREGILIGSRLEQIQSLEINGVKAKLLPKTDNPNGNPGNINERTFVYEEPNVRQASGQMRLALQLEDNRMMPVVRTFIANPVRPSFVAEQGEIEAVYPAESVIPRPQYDLTSDPVIPVEAPELNLMLRSRLTDYDFKPENLAIEIRIEKSEKGVQNPVLVDLEVLDPQTVRVRIAPGEELKKLLGGRRVQLRLKDRERGISEWYTVRQTFVRLPRIESINCPAQLNGSCEITGAGLDYIGGVSVDGGATWHPEAAGTLPVSTGGNGSNRRLIPLLAEKDALRIKLRDYPPSDGLSVTNYLYKK